MMINMVCPRDYVLRTTLGHTIAFKAGHPQPVPEAAYHEAIAKNILPVRIKGETDTAFGLASAEITGSLRDALVYDAIRVLVSRNHTEDFTGGGMPKAASITKEVGVQVTAQEMSKYWAGYKQITSENGEFPSHPNVETVRELQGLGTRKQFEQFAVDLGVEVPATKGKSLSELKAMLLYTILNQHQAPFASAAPEEGEYVKPDSLMED